MEGLNGSTVPGPGFGDPTGGVGATDPRLGRAGTGAGPRLGGGTQAAAGMGGGGKVGGDGEDICRDAALNREGLSVSIMLEGWGERSHHLLPFKALEGLGHSGLVLLSPSGAATGCTCNSSTERAAK